MKYLITILALLMLNNCERSLEENSRIQFDAMCDRQELIICGDDIPINKGNDLITQGNYTSMYIPIPVEPVDYTYESDEYNTFEYMEAPDRRGDCEDYAITLIEDNIRSGAITKGNAQLVVGEFYGNGHAWAIVNGDTLYDTDNVDGIPLSEAEGYVASEVIYEY